MARLIVLGSANAVPDQRHDNTHFVIVGNRRTLLIDCASNPVVRLNCANIPLNNISDLLLTHFHPDHVSGMALLLMNMWLASRSKPLQVFGNQHTLERTQGMLELYSWREWPNFFPLTFSVLPDKEMNEISLGIDFNVFTSPVHHFIPTVGLRAEFASGKIWAYSCDTEPCSEVIQLAQDADILFHEANVSSTHVDQIFPGHSSALQAGQIAYQAHVKKLYLVHYNTEDREDDLISQASLQYQGPVELAKDFTEFLF